MRAAVDIPDNRWPHRLGDVWKQLFLTMFEYVHVLLFNVLGHSMNDCCNQVSKFTSMIMPRTFRRFLSSWSMLVKFLAAFSLASCLCSSVLYMKT